MIKIFGFFTFFVFIVLGSQIGGMAPGFSIWFISLLLVLSGTLTVALLQFPNELEEGRLSLLLNSHLVSQQRLIQEVEVLAQVIRRDGLLAVEGLRKEMKDPLLKYLLKRVMDGFEKQHLVGTLQNQTKRQEELFQMLQSYFDRVAQFIPAVGLVGSLFVMMDYFKASSASGTATLSLLFVPLLLALLMQFVVQSIFQKYITDALDRSRLYFTLMEEGILGIQEGLNAELLRDKMQFRLLKNPKWTDT